MSAYINTVCARVTNTLSRLNKELLTAEDVKDALSAEGIVSIDGRRKYTAGDGYLSEGGWLKRCIGGWVLPPEAETAGVIIIKVTPGMATGQVFKKVSKALEPFRGFTEMRMEV